jgi:hypothetical protein
MGAPAIFEKQIEIKLLHPASTLESRIQVEIKLLRPASTLESRIQEFVTQKREVRMISKGLRDEPAGM